MKLDVPSGKYVVAVSGGVDSMVLLDLLHRKSGLELVVAHFDHGIREDSHSDAELVKNVAAGYGLIFETKNGNLGTTASENQAREARYEFLEFVKYKHQADSVITAHHQDDLLETALINILRGSGRRGITSIADNSNIIRPLLATTKEELRGYAKDHNIIWREDLSNQDDKYLRNYLRQHILPALSDTQRSNLLDRITEAQSINKQVENLIATISQNIISGRKIDRQKFSMLPQEVGDELVLVWLRDNKLTYDKKLVKRLSLVLKTAKSGTKFDISKLAKVVMQDEYAHIEVG